ncbi:AAA family ATPase [Clostridiisalibacter paucivorans]|uniref:AAA family ATPase n=1 Tax=Clostridiisalibacter paucivorans TaxID=408753 RepID=UPI00047EBD8B|nr:ATP-binding protein [Clostridiisalibacter paucivorans]
MLIRARISNFMSIGILQELCMISGKARGKREHLHKSKGMNLLRLTAIYGTNASGKSNLISSLEFARKVIVKDIPKGYTNKYNRTNGKNKEKPSHFEFEIKLDEKYYSYGFEIILNKNSIVSEWLYELSPDNKSSEIFYRNLIDERFNLGKYFRNEKIANRLKIYFDDVKRLDSVLFLSEMNRNKTDLYKKKNELSVFRNVFNWFEDSLDINYPDRVFSSYSYFMKKANSDEICEMIKRFDTGITNFKIIDAKREDLSNTIPSDILKKVFDDLEKEITESKKQKRDIESLGALLRGNKDFYIFEVNKNYEVEIKTIEFQHGSSGTFRLSEESDGTRRILELIEILFSENDNKVYIIDEIDRSLHPLLTRQFIKAYLDSLGNKRTQLIITTHESRLLDLDLLRRDEIWFMNNNPDGESELYSLEQYNERFDKKIDKAYLSGRYGAIPNFREE